MLSLWKDVQISSKNSSTLAYCFWFLLLALCSSSSSHAQPSSRLYYALLSDDGSLSRISPYYKFFPVSRSVPVADQDDNDMLAKRSPMKKYDRNCFFSPVQCMLSYDKNADEALYRGRR